MSDQPSRRSRRPSTYRTLLTAVDALLEEGVPRRTLTDAGLSVDQVAEWQRTFALADEVVAALSAPSALQSGRLRTRLVVIASALGALARDVGLDREPAAVAEFVALRRALDAAFERARDRESMLTGTRADRPPRRR